MSYSIAFQYKTFALALIAATAGQAILVPPGTYVCALSLFIHSLTLFAFLLYSCFH